MDWCRGRIKEVSLCKYAEKCNEKIDCTSSDDWEKGIFPVYCVGFWECRCMRDDGGIKMSEAVRRMTREELIAERDEYRLEADRQYQNKCKLECQIKEMQSHIDCLKAELAEIQMNKQEPSAKSFEILEIPIQKASVLIWDTQDKYQEVYGMNDGFSMAISDLKQIAEHLLVYCNHAEVE